MAEPKVARFEALGRDFDAQMEKGKAIRLLEAEIARLEARVQDLVECNNRARDAEEKVREYQCLR